MGRLPSLLFMQVLCQRKNMGKSPFPACFRPLPFVRRQFHWQGKAAGAAKDLASRRRQRNVPMAQGKEGMRSSPKAHLRAGTAGIGSPLLATIPA